MKCIKMVGLLIMAVVALATFATTASATTLTSPTGTTYTSTIKAESEGTTSLHGSFPTVSCTASTVEGKVEKHGSGVTAGGKVSSLTFTGCNHPVTVLARGSLEVHPTGCGTYCRGTVTSSGAEITIKTSIANCIFTTTSTDVGTLTGTDATSGHATHDIDSSAIPRTGHSIFCGSSGEWTGSYTVTTPSTLYVDP